MAGQPAVGFASHIHHRYRVLGGGHGLTVWKPPCQLLLSRNSLFVIIDKAWWPHGQDARRTPKDERTKRASSLHMQSVPVVCRGAVREVSLTSRVAGRKEVRVEEASCHIPTMTTVLWSWELRRWHPCLHGILRQPMGRAAVRRATGSRSQAQAQAQTKTVPVSSDRECHTWLVERQIHTEKKRSVYAEEGMQGKTRVVRAHTTHSRQVIPQHDT